MSAARISGRAQQVGAGAAGGDRAVDQDVAAAAGEAQGLAGVV